ncbi:ATP synthase subunit I [Bacillus licheniformis]|nr:ATP synthase subunit I [Bacillus licheniformis]
MFLGLITGTVFSYFNLWLLAKRMQAFDKAVAKGKMIRSLGTASRLCNAIIAAAIAYKYPEYIHLARSLEQNTTFCKMVRPPSLP